MNDKTAYSERIETLLAERKWDRTLAARKLGITYPGLTKVLDKGGEFGVDNLFKAAQVFDVNPYWLHTGEGERGHWMPSARPAPVPDKQAAEVGLSDQAMTLGRLLDSTCGDDVLAKTEAMRQAAFAVLQAQSGSPAPRHQPASTDQARKPSA